MKTLSIGFSPCPNDTYIFCALVKGHIKVDDFNLKPVILEDVETLNRWAMEGRLDITKLSFHAFGHVLEKYALLNAGSALGRGCGPLLVSNRPLHSDSFAHLTVAVPGRYTTAAMLLRLYSPVWKKVVAMRFDEIMPAIEAAEVDCGVIIHESRFTYQDRSLVLITDLGSWWEEISGHPIPLGGIAVKRSLGNELIQKIDHSIRSSILWTQKNPQACRSYIKEHSQELEDRVINDHIGLYVNSFSENLGTEGMAAIDFFLKKGHEVGLFPRQGENSLTISY
jgi:1,4-dihydroxy-6-naphthoate synthase